MTDFNKLFSNLRTKMQDVSSPPMYASLRSDINNYFSQINSDFNFKSENEANYNDWIESMDDKNRKMHIYFYNKLDNIKNKSKYYLNLKEHNLANDQMKNFVTSKVGEMKKQNNVNKNKIKVNKRMAKYYNESIESTNYYRNIFKYIFFALVFISFIMFLVKKQYTNLKVLFYLMLLTLFPYIIQPIWNIMTDYTYKTNRVYHLYFSYYFLIFVFSLFISFKYYVFNEGSESEGRRNLYALGFIIFFGIGCLIANWLYYNIGMKT